MRKLFTLCLLIVSLSASAQWQQTGSKVRYVNGLGIPTKDTAAGVLADSSQILIRPQDSALYVKYKRTWLRVGGGGGSIAGSGTTNYIPKFTSSTAIGNSSIFDNGNVGIGTASPSSKLDVTGNFRTTGLLQTNDRLYIASDVAISSWISSSLSGSYSVTNSYGWLNSANNFVFGTDGSERMRITSTGNVGIGETSPNGKLDVRSATGHVGINTGTSLSPERGNLYYTTDGTGWNLNIGKLQSGTFTPQMTFQDNGNVGIGTTSPATDLQISRAGSSTFRLTNTSNTTNVELGIATALGFVGTNTDNSFAINTNNTERVRVTNTGNVGIGTTSPVNKLDVFATNRTALNTTGSGVNVNYSGTTTGEYATIGFSWANSIGNNSTQWGMGMVGTNFVSGTAALNFFTNGSERMRITSGGNALIGTTTDNGTDKLQVSGSASVTSSLGIGTSPSVGALHIKTTSPRIVLDDNDNNGTASLWFRPQSSSFSIKGSIELISTGSAAPTRFVIASTDTMTFRTNNVERMRITSAGGNLLISTTTDNNTDKLQVNGSIQGTGFNQAYTAKTGTYTATTSDYFIDCTSGTFTVNLFTAVGNTGRILIIKNSGAGTITVDPNGAQTIDGAATQSLSTQWSRVHIISDGANWKIISN